MPNKSDPWVLGISASHNGAACLLKGERVVVAIQEERLVGLKRARLFLVRPSLAVNYCLEYAGLKPSEIDLLVVTSSWPASDPSNDLATNDFYRNIKDSGVPGYYVPHHTAHVISAFATSGFRDAAGLVIDGLGSPPMDLPPDEQRAIVDMLPDGRETTSLYSLDETLVKPLEKHLVAKGLSVYEPPPGASMKGFGSLGGMFEAISAQIFGDQMEAGKVMGLAPYGKPTIGVEEFFEIRDGRFIFPNRVCSRFTDDLRWPHHKQEYQDLACSVQVALETALKYLTDRLQQLCPSKNLVFAGGVALNSVANERIVRESGYDKVFFVPPAEDSGPALGAAYYGLWKLLGKQVSQAMKKDAFGKSYREDEIAGAIDRVPAIQEVSSGDFIADVADLLIDGKNIGWFSGGSELGPRALGQRSILCDPRRADAKKTLNRRVKHREGFRPFAPVVLREEVEHWFEVDGVDPDSPFMLRVYDFKKDKREQVPGVVHVDGTGRVQTITKEVNGSYYDLLRNFYEKTGVPILLNTSMNVMGEPIVETPEEALWCLLFTGLDYCVLENRIITKRKWFKSVLEFYPYFLLPKGSGTEKRGKHGDPYMAYWVTTPWGGAELPVSRQPNVAMVKLMADGLADGATKAKTILKKLRREVGSIDDATFIRFLVQLRRGRIINLSKTPRK